MRDLSVIEPSTGFVFDQMIAMNGFTIAEDYPEQLRRIRFKDPESSKILIFLTNNTTLPTLTIAALYKKCWQSRSGEARSGVVRQMDQATCGSRVVNCRLLLSIWLFAKRTI